MRGKGGKSLSQDEYFVMYKSRYSVLRLRINSRNFCIKPIARESFSSSGSKEVPLLSSHCLKLCQKREVTVQFTVLVRVRVGIKDGDYYCYWAYVSRDTPVSFR